MHNKVNHSLRLDKSGNTIQMKATIMCQEMLILYKTKI
jgi:hypothetical protein